MIKKEVLGERKIIEQIVKTLHKMPHMPIPFGDDISGMDIGDGKLAILKCDMLVGHTDIPKGMTLGQAARKAVIMNVSDLASKGVQPRVAMVSLGLPRSTMLPDIKQIAAGLNEGAREYGTHIIGGDTNECDDIVIGCYLLGIAERRMIPLRSGAQPGDLVAVTGEFGNTLAGLKALSSDVEIPPSVKDALLASIYMPKARLKEGIALVHTGAVRASMDSSDGLAWSLHEIARASSVGMELDDLPVSNAALDYARITNTDPIDLALYGGEEFELVLTIRENASRRALRTVKSLHIIGRVTRQKGKVTLSREGKHMTVKAVGWEHFTSSTPPP